MKKITFLMLHLNYGGIEKQVSTLVNELVKDYEIEIISLYNILDGKSFYELDPNIKVRYIFNFGPNKKELLNCLKRGKIVSFFKELIKSFKILYTKYFGLKKVINDLNTDIIISSRIEFSKQINRKDVITISQEHSFIDNKRYIRKIKKSFKGINYLIVMTKKAKEKYNEWLKNVKNKPKIIVIPNMIKENKEEKLSALNNNQIISIGRLEEVKDFNTLIVVFSLLIKKYPSLILKIIGSGSQKNNLQEFISKYNLQNNVILTGSLNEEEIKNELLKSDIFVLTSKSESFSLVLCEAMNYGLPCVAFDVDVGPREIIDNNKTGFLIKDRNIDEMEEKIEKLLDDKNKREKYGKNSRKKVMNFYPKNIKNLWISLFENNNNYLEVDKK